MNPKHQIDYSNIIFTPFWNPDNPKLTILTINNISKVKGLKRPITTRAWDISFYVDDVLDTEGYYEFKIKYGVDTLESIAYCRVLREPVGYTVALEHAETVKALVYSIYFENSLTGIRYFTIKAFQNLETFLLHLYIFLQESI